MTKTTTATTRSILLTALFAIGVVAAGRGCGGVTDERVAARTKASKAYCDSVQRCEDIGPGLTYESYQSCITIIEGMIDQTYLPESQCKDIDQPALNVCISALESVLCDNIIDLIVKLGTSCSKESLCVGVRDAGAGG
jgi:hypothetical protein